VVDVRRVRPDEWRDLRELRLESLQDSPDAFWRRHDEELETPDEDWRERAESPCFVAVEDERLVGMVVGMADDEDDRLANLYAMYVKPGARGRGIGEALVNAHVAWARDAGFARVRLMVNVDNESAHRLYERCGFRDTGHSEPLRDGPQVLREMVRAL
jgi:ribosomal protein S18 acetylase RimI-like enzyme